MHKVHTKKDFMHMNSWFSFQFDGWFLLVFLNFKIIRSPKQLNEPNWSLLWAYYSTMNHFATRAYIISTLMPSSPKSHGLKTTTSKPEMSQVIFYWVVYRTNSLNCQNEGIAPNSFWQKITMQFSVHYYTLKISLTRIS